MRLVTLVGIFFYERSAALSNRWITKKRKSLGLTQHQLAKKADVPFSRLSYAETNRIDLLPDEVDRIESVFRSRAQVVFDSVCAE